MEYNQIESGIDMNSSNELIQHLSSPERSTTTKLTPRALVYDDIDGEGDEMPCMIRRRIHAPFSSTNNNNINNNNNNIDDADKSIDDDDDTSEFFGFFNENNSQSLPFTNPFCLFICLVF